VLAIGGIISLLLGSLMLVKASSSLEMVKISRVVIVSATTVTALFFLFVVGAGLKAQRRRVVTGSEALAGLIGEAIDLLDPSGTVKVQGEIWKAESVSGKIDAGEKIRVISMKDLKLYVEKINSTTGNT
jgi:membrane-bound serine protease (ClpP class)